MTSKLWRQFTDLKRECERLQAKVDEFELSGSVDKENDAALTALKLKKAEDDLEKLRVRLNLPPKRR